MRRPRSILTVFHDLRVEHLYKDVGAIPYHLASECGWRSTVAFFGAMEPFDAPVCAGWREKVSLLSLGPRRGLAGNAWSMFCLLARRGRQFDLLNFYHDSVFMMVYALCYLFFNPRGKVYFKLDYGHLALAELRRQEKSLLTRLRRRLKGMLSRRAVHLYSTETRTLFDALSEDPYFAGRLALVPNGFACPPLCLDEVMARKENIIVQVGNLGSFAKNTELLVEALAALDPPLLQGWKVVLAGPVVNPCYYEKGFEPVDDFTPFLARVLREHPHLERVIVKAGELQDRAELYALYRRSRIFCLTSRYEGFPHVVAEAMWFGNLLIASDLPACRDVTDDGRVGELFPSEDADSLVALLRQSLGQDIDVEGKGRLSHALIGSRFNWCVIVRELESVLFPHDPSAGCDSASGGTSMRSFR